MIYNCIVIKRVKILWLLLKNIWKERFWTYSIVFKGFWVILFLQLFSIDLENNIVT